MYSAAQPPQPTQSAVTAGYQEACIMLFLRLLTPSYVQSNACQVCRSAVITMPKVSAQSLFISLSQTPWGILPTTYESLPAVSNVASYCMQMM